MNTVDKNEKRNASIFRDNQYLSQVFNQIFSNMKIFLSLQITVIIRAFLVTPSYLYLPLASTAGRYIHFSD